MCGGMKWCGGSEMCGGMKWCGGSETCGEAAKKGLHRKSETV